MNPNLKYAAEFLKAFWRAKIFHRRIPLFVSWALTYRCNSHCKYCDMPSRVGHELDFSQITKIIEILARRGSRFLSLTGGEPLLREDIGKIVDFGRQRGFCVKLNSNGILFSQKVNELKNLSALALSFDGPESVHDSMRGAGSYSKLMQAVDAAKTNNIPISFYTVLSEVNIDYLKDILTLARQAKIGIMFQPATQTLYGSARLNPVATPVEKYQAALSYLLTEKKKKHSFILNSEGGLAVLSRWPAPVEIQCVNGLLGCRIEPDGQVRLCSLTTRIQTEAGTPTGDFEKSFDALLLGIKCRDCWCAPQIELNRMVALKWDAIINALGLF